MIATDTAVMLARYNDWADRTLFAAIATLPPEAATRTRTTLFRSMIGTLNHNFQVDLIWRAHLLGEPHGFTSRRDLLHPKLDALVPAQLAVNGWMLGWAASQTPESLAEMVDFAFVSGAPARMQRGAMFLHIVNHKTYHRGWVAEMFFDSGVNPPQTDLSVFLTEAAAG